jgi:hypothetical protein
MSYFAPQPGGGNLLPADVNSAVLGDIGFARDWFQLPGSLGVKLRPNESANLGGTFQDAHLLNPYSDAPALSYAGMQVVAPPGATSLTFSVPMSGSGTMQLLVMNAAGSSQLAASATITLTGSLTTYSVTYNGVAAGTNYQLWIPVNYTGVTSGNLPITVGRVSLTWGGATGLLAFPYMHLHVPNWAFVDNGQSATDVGPLGYRTSAFARLVIDTTAPSLLLDFFSTMYGQDQGSSLLGVKVGSPGRTRWYTSIAATAQATLLTATLALPSGFKRVEIHNGPTYAPENGMFVTSVRSIYAPSDCLLTLPVAA